MWPFVAVDIDIKINRAEQIGLGFAKHSISANGFAKGSTMAYIGSLGYRSDRVI
jgi:hypothetical protein